MVMPEITITPDLRIVSNRLSRMVTDLLTPIITEAAYAAAPKIEAAIKNNTPVSPRPGPQGHAVDKIHTEVQLGGAGRSARIITKGPGYLRFVIKGTAPHDIEPHNGRMLAWLNPDGSFSFAKRVHHPGQRPNPFVDRALAEVMPSIYADIRATGLRAWRDIAGFNK